MSAKLERQLREDKSLRDAARAIVDVDISNVKADFAVKNIAARTATRMQEGAIDVFEEAVEVADDNRGALAALLAAVMLWFARNPLMSVFSDTDLEESDSPQDNAEPG